MIDLLKAIGVVFLLSTLAAVCAVAFIRSGQGRVIELQNTIAGTERDKPIEIEEVVEAVAGALSNDLIHCLGGYVTRENARVLEVKGQEIAVRIDGKEYVVGVYEGQALWRQNRLLAEAVRRVNADPERSLEQGIQDQVDFEVQKNKQTYINWHAEALEVLRKRREEGLL